MFISLNFIRKSEADIVFHIYVYLNMYYFTEFYLPCQDS